MSFIESNWRYAKLGRVISQLVQKGPGPTQVVRQDLTYFGNDDPKSLDHWLGVSNHKRFEFSYDHRHQLIGVTETAAGGTFTATYAYSPAGHFTDVMHAAQPLPGSNVKPRDIRYQYASEDPEQVTALVNADSSTFARYEYDKAGNQLRRCLDGCTGDAIELVYDGKDQLRGASRIQGGSEEYRS